MKTKIEISLNEVEFKEAVADYINKTPFFGVNISPDEVRIESTGSCWCTVSISAGE